MSYPVIAVHAIIRVPDGEKKQVQVAPGSKFKIGDKAEYEQLKSAGAVADDTSAKGGSAAEKAAAEKAAAEKAAAEKAAAEKAAAEKAAAEKAAAEKNKGGKAGAADDVVG